MINESNNFKLNKKLYKYQHSIDEIASKTQRFKVLKPLKQRRLCVFEIYCEMLKRKSS